MNLSSSGKSGSAGSPKDCPNANSNTNFQEEMRQRHKKRNLINYNGANSIIDDRWGEATCGVDELYVRWIEISGFGYHS